MRKKALSYVNEALAHLQGDRSGSLFIRSTLHLYLGQVGDAMSGFKEVIRIRKEAGDNHGRIGEAEVSLGQVYFLQGRIWRAQRLLEAGVEHLEESGSMEFTVRAMREMSRFYALTLRRRRARAVLDRAYALAREKKLQGQIQQLDSVKRLFWGEDKE